MQVKYMKQWKIMKCCSSKAPPAQCRCTKTRNHIICQKRSKIYYITNQLTLIWSSQLRWFDSNRCQTFGLLYVASLFHLLSILIWNMIEAFSSYHCYVITFIEQNFWKMHCSWSADSWSKKIQYFAITSVFAIAYLVFN